MAIEHTKKNRESGKVNVAVVVFVLVLIASILVSNLVGPTKGWIQNLVSSPPPTPAKLPPPPKPKITRVIKKAEKKPVVVVEAPKPPPPPPPEKPVKKKIDMKKLYDEFFAKYRKKFPNPKVGKEYTVYMKAGVIEGKLKKFSDGKVVIQSPGVTMTCRIDMVSKRSYPELFPKRAAKILALRALKKRLAEEREASKEASPEASEASQGSSGNSSATRHRGKVVYDPSLEKTPKTLFGSLKSFGEWIKAQQRHVGGKLADKIYAKRSGRGVVVYVKTSSLFRKQDYDVRYSVAEAMWQVWGFKCADYGVVGNPEDAHVVLLDPNDKPVGGSKENDASSIWVKK
jgi:hypothetical protein